MSLEDPYFVVRNEVQGALGESQQSYRRWQELYANKTTQGGQEYEWLKNKLLNSLKSIDWDLEDLSETISVVESNPAKFRLTEQEINERKNFIYSSKDAVKKIKDHIGSAEVRTQEETVSRDKLVGAVQPKTKGKYAKLDNELESANSQFIADQQQQQQMEVAAQDVQLEMVGQSMKVLKNMGQEMNSELQVQNQMLDEFVGEVDQTQSRLDWTLLRLEKVMRLTTDRRQMCIIFALLVMLVVIVLLFAFTL
ncbi:syntaxin-6-like [Sycon ciliatum]|uniref:syntaxin-6-like n=1 Tax=Sycon ciliatum TaxID=27933 RepID=UPI0020A89E70|eukprot:scpid65305/ scgid27941/ Syntaxin-6 &gt; Syntaxin-6